MLLIFCDDKQKSNMSALALFPCCLHNSNLHKRQHYRNAMALFDVFDHKIGKFE
jgi:hypothetical protein